MGFRKGYSIKPKQISTFGQVIFTDGVNDCAANQATCEAYGYTFDRSRGTCQAYPPQRLDAVMAAEHNLQNSRSGVDNEVGEGSFFNDINGVRNKIKTGVQNSLICGEYNEISDGVFDASVKGKYGKSIRQGEQLYGGGNPYFPGLTEPPYGCGYFQASTIQLTAETIDDNATKMLVLGIEDIKIEANSLISFSMTFNTINKSTGGYSYIECKGTFLVKDDLQTIICTTEPQIICQSKEDCTVSFEFKQITESIERQIVYKDIELLVTGCRDQSLLHHAVMKLHETKTNTSI
tara:strand:- start:3773 stop:4648 length:876 start_codon:yes stop_codon:yes gene_type:complete